jgi:hypothetical protein
MSDFDQFFAEKLDQEAHYPGRAKNWNRLGQRLDAFAEGGSSAANGSQHWAHWAWKAATGALLVTSSVLLWQYAAVQKEREQMRQQQQRLEQMVADLQQQASETPVVASSASAQRAASAASPVFPEKNGGAADAPAAAAPLNAATNRSATTTKTFASTPRPAAPNAAASTATPQRTTAVPPPFSGKKHDTAAVTTATQQQPAVAAAAPLPGSPQSADGTTLAAAATAAAGNLPSQDIAAPGAQPTAPPAVAEAAAAAGSPSDSSAARPVPPVFPEKKDGVAAAADSSAGKTLEAAKSAEAGELPRDTTAAKPAVASASEQPIVRPLRQRFQLRGGIGALIGSEQPRQQGIALITGQGISASLSLWRSRFWLAGGADWLRFGENAERHQPEFHAFPNPPKSPWGGGGGPNPKNHELVQVEAAHRQQRYHLGLRYELPKLLGLRPTLQAAHVWARSTPMFVEYTFEDKDPGGPNPMPGKKFDRMTLKEPARSHNNIWQLGAGLEYDLAADWTLSLRADYQAQASAGAGAQTFDALFLRAGLEYRIR